jgi:hypothetical protein
MCALHPFVCVCVCVFSNLGYNFIDPACYVCDSYVDACVLVLLSCCVCACIVSVYPYINCIHVMANNYTCIPSSRES